MGSVEPGPDDVAGGPEHHRGPVPGPAPRFPGMPRWVLAPGVPDSALPPVPAYDCRRVAAPPVIDGTVEGGAWDRVAWSAPFVEIESGRAEGPRRASRSSGTRNTSTRASVSRIPTSAGR